jgi:tetratricopeptide (TPR) repeat protein
MRYAQDSMSKANWFRNTVWNERAAKLFFTKLARARDKAQYLRIQACTLAQSHPEVALELLREYFLLGEHFDHAQAYVDQATAYLTLGDVPRAVEAYGHALAREQKYPNLRTSAIVDLPFLIATSRMRERYDAALDLLRQGSSKCRVLFPVDIFKHHASIALISADVADIQTAQQHAARALEVAAAQDSGFRYHPGVGLVGSKFENTRASLTAILSP